MQGQEHKQWWAPVWTGLVMDESAKHYRRMKGAVWLFLYLVLGANRKTGVLMRKVKTISRDMGVTRDTTLRWLTVLRKEGYIVTVSTGRYLTIQIKKWKALPGVGRTQHQKLEISNTRSWKYPTPSFAPVRPIPDHFGPKTVISAPPNETKINIIIKNEMQQAVTSGPDDGAFKSIGACAHQELLAWELARSLDDPAGIDLYRSYCRKYPEELLKKAMTEVGAVPAYAIKKGRSELFNYLIHKYAQGTIENRGH